MRYQVEKPCGCQGVSYQDGDFIAFDAIPVDAARSLIQHGCIREVPDAPPAVEETATETPEEAAPETQPEQPKAKTKK